MHIDAYKERKAMTPSLLLLTWFGAGRSPVAPGTTGSLAALPFAYGILVFSGNLGLLGATLLVLVLGTYLCIQYAHTSQDKDPSFIVIDEVVGQWIPLLAAGFDWRLWIVSFVSFRFFDITKVWPACRVDGISSQANPCHKGTAIMMDDVVAGIYALSVVVAVGYFLGF